MRLTKTESQETARSLREQLGTLPIYILAFLYVSAHKARWLWVVFFIFCVLVPALLVLGGFGCIVIVTLPNHTLGRTSQSREPADVRGVDTIEAGR